MHELKGRRKKKKRRQVFNRVRFDFQCSGCFDPSRRPPANPRGATHYSLPSRFQSFSPPVMSSPPPKLPRSSCPLPLHASATTLALAHSQTPEETAHGHRQAPTSMHGSPPTPTYAQQFSSGIHTCTSMLDPRPSPSRSSGCSSRCVAGAWHARRARFGPAGSSPPTTTVRHFNRPSPASASGPGGLGGLALDPPPSLPFSAARGACARAPPPSPGSRAPRRARAAS
jgi:hypothetical protein